MQTNQLLCYLRLQKPLLTPEQCQMTSHRHKGHILPHKKPRWIPPAPSKKFKLAPKDHTPESEVIQMNILKLRYKVGRKSNVAS